MTQSEVFRIPSWLLQEHWWMHYFSKNNTFRVYISDKKNRTFEGEGNSIAEAAKGALKGRTAANPPKPLPKKQKIKSGKRKFTKEEAEFSRYNHPCFIMNDSKT